MSKFNGLSSPEELKQTWFNMTEGQGFDDVNIIWNFDDTTEIKEDGAYIVNILYKYIGNKVGHYVALYKNKDCLIYFDPMGTLPPAWIAKMFKTFICDLEGCQAITGTSCGYRCLTKLFKYSLGYYPAYYVLFNGQNILGDIKENTFKKTRRELKILEELI